MYEVGTPEKAVGEMALRAYRIMGCRDAGRVDLIVQNGGGPTVLEVNPLPGLNPTHSDLPIIATGVGLGYNQLIESILTSALERCSDNRKNVSDFHLRSIVTNQRKK